MTPSVPVESQNEIHSFYKYVTEQTDRVIAQHRAPASGTLRFWSRCDTRYPPLSGSSKAQCCIRTPTSFGVSYPIAFGVGADGAVRAARPGNGLLVCAAGGLSLNRVQQAAAGNWGLYENARPDNWDAAQSKWLVLRPASALLLGVTVWEQIRTEIWAGAFAFPKPWYDAIRLKSGHLLGPVADMPQQRREWLVGTF
jgi:hypothetical protein